MSEQRLLTISVYTLASHCRLRQRVRNRLWDNKIDPRTEWAIAVVKSGNVLEELRSRGTRAIQGLAFWMPEGIHSLTDTRGR